MRKFKFDVGERVFVKTPMDTGIRVPPFWGTIVKQRHGALGKHPSYVVHEDGHPEWRTWLCVEPQFESEDPNL